MNKRKVMGVFLALALATQVGCSTIDKSKDTNAGEDTKPPVAESNTEQKKVMEELTALAQKEDNLRELLPFVNNNFSLVSKENGNIMVNVLEEAQKKALPKLEEKFYSGAIQQQLMAGKKSIEDINQIKGIEDGETKALLEETRSNGFKVETAEGMFFPIIDYRIYEKYRSSVTEDIKAYIEIMVTESEEVPAKDAALVIGWDEVLRRAMEQEKFIQQYEESLKIHEVKQLYDKYAFFTFLGTNNTPLFEYDTKRMVPEAKAAYRKAVDIQEDSKLLEKVKGLLEILEKSNDKLTDEADKYRKNALDELKK